MTTRHHHLPTAAASEVTAAKPAASIHPSNIPKLTAAQVQETIALDCDKRMSHSAIARHFHIGRTTLRCYWAKAKYQWTDTDPEEWLRTERKRKTPKADHSRWPNRINGTHQPKLTAKQGQELYTLYQQKWGGYSRLAYKYGITRSVAKSIINRIENPTPNTWINGQPKLTPKHRAQLLADWQTGTISKTGLSKKYGVGRSTIQKIIKIATSEEERKQIRHRTHESRRKNNYREKRKARDPQYAANQEILEFGRRTLRFAIGLDIYNWPDEQMGNYIGLPLNKYAAYICKPYPSKSRAELLGPGYELHHIRPRYTFNLELESERRACARYSNTQLLTKEIHRPIDRPIGSRPFRYNLADGTYSLLLPSGRFTKHLTWEEACARLEPLIGQYPWYKQPSNR